MTARETWEAALAMMEQARAESRAELALSEARVAKLKAIAALEPVDLRLVPGGR